MCTKYKGINTFSVNTPARRLFHKLRHSASKGQFRLGGVRLRRDETIAILVLATMRWEYIILWSGTIILDIFIKGKNILLKPVNTN
jgi:hypothetical protein